MHFASWKEHRAVAALKPIHQAESTAVARERLEDFDSGPWGQKYPAIAQSWRRNWEQVIPFFALAPELRQILYTTNAIRDLKRPGPQSGETPRTFSQRGGRYQAHLAGAAQCSNPLEKSADFMAGCEGAVGDSVRGQVYTD